MPKYVDYHAELPPMPAEVQQQAAERLKAGQTNEFGVKGLNVYFGTNGAAWCVSEGPSIDAVVKSHQALGIPLEAAQVVEVQSMV